MKKILYFVAFIAGAAIGALGTVKYINKHYDISEKTDETEEPIREEKDDDVVLKFAKDPEDDEYEKSREEYFRVSSIYGGEEIVKRHEVPYVIRQDQFSEFSDYSAVELTLYSDGTVADDRDEIVPNAEELLGPNFRSMFKEGEDELYIRNDERCCDYAVSKDLQPYDAFEDERPHLREE